MQKICDVQGQAASRLRINRLRESENLEETARAVLKRLGEIKRPYLTAVAVRHLSCIVTHEGCPESRVQSQS
jgi:hypothetical protein